MSQREPFPLPWIDRLFSKLTIRYGRDFLSRYEGVDMVAVKTDWSIELSGLQHRPWAITHALDHPTTKAPNVVEFVAMCRLANDPPQKALEAPPVDPSRVAKVLASIAQAIAPAHDLLGRQREHMRCEFRGDKTSVRQREFWRIALRSEILRMTGIDTATKFDIKQLADAMRGKVTI